MQTFKITTVVKGKESPATDWKLVPRIGETVELSDRVQYRVMDVVHHFHRGKDSGIGEVSIILENPKDLE